MALSKLDHWRLVDELSVVDAAILITGNDPDKFHDIPISNFDRRSDFAQYDKYEGFRATFTALRSAITNNILRATLAYRARTPLYSESISHGFRNLLPKEIVSLDKGRTAWVEFDILVRVDHENQVRLSSHDLDDLRSAGSLLILREPDWSESTIAVEELKQWLSNKGLRPKFFFPDAPEEEFRDSAHPRYSPKLACAIAAWEAVKSRKRNMSVKATIEEWVHANAVTFGMVGPDGQPTKAAVQQVAGVVNWQTGGGAIPTGETEAASDKKQIDPIQNFIDANEETEDDLPS